MLLPFSFSRVTYIFHASVYFSGTASGLRLQTFFLKVVDTYFATVLLLYWHRSSVNVVSDYSLEDCHSNLGRGKAFFV